MNNGPRRRPMRGAPAEKAKDFKSAIKRLFHELKSFHFLIILSLVLAALGSLLSIFAPDKLSELTDEISSGLVINKDNMTVLSSHLSSKLSEENLKSELPNIFAIDLSERNISNILTSNKLTKEDKDIFQNFLSKNF